MFVVNSVFGGKWMLMSYVCGTLQRLYFKDQINLCLYNSRTYLMVFF